MHVGTFFSVFYQVHLFRGSYVIFLLCLIVCSIVIHSFAFLDPSSVSIFCHLVCSLTRPHRVCKPCHFEQKGGERYDHRLRGTAMRDLNGEL